MVEFYGCDSVGALSDRLTDLEQTVQSRRTTPVIDATASMFLWRHLLLMHEVGRAKDENNKSMLRHFRLA